MTTQEVAKRLVELNRANDTETIFGELYSKDAVSVENWGPEPMVYTGLLAIQEKATQWYEDVVEIHSVVCSEPLVSDSSFAVTFAMDITYKSRGREAMTELAVYTVKEGKVVREEFQA